jgi:FkbM family methyltransferase
MNIRKQLPHFSKRPLLVSTHAYRRYWTRSLGYIHSDMSVAIDLYVKPGAIVWDIGANMGVFAFLSALRAGSTGRVYAFEAYVECATLITRSKKWRQPDEAEVVICPFALSEETGTLAFQVSSYRSAASAIQGFGRFGFGGTVREVPTLTVDDLAERFVPPTIIKIDVEGAENLVLRGARDTLQRHRPVLLLETSGGQVGKETEEFLRSMGYKWKPWLAEGPFLQGNLPAGDTVAMFL